MSREEDVLEWLIENKSTGDDKDVIEEVTAKTLGTLIQNIDNLVVVFCKFKNQLKIFSFSNSLQEKSLILDQKDNEESDKVIEELEKIDDDCDKHGIQFVKTDDKSAAKEHGVKEVRLLLIVKCKHFEIFVSPTIMIFSVSNNNLL